MKKINYISSFCLILLLSFSSCEPATYCAECVELNTGYNASLFCGSNSEVNDYMDELESYDPNYPDQNWSCSKSLE